MDLSKTKFTGNVHSDQSVFVEFRRDPEVKLEQVEHELFGHSNSTPLGQLLEMIGSLPEIRQDKVFNVRDRLDTECYDLDHTLDSAIDKVLEELLSES